MKGASAEGAPTAEAPLIVDRYAIYDAIASGGMATVHLGRLIGNAGFLRTVAIKRLHSQFAHDPEFTSMFLDEARLASRIQHPNVVSTLDVVMKENELLLVMEYVRGESLSRLVRRARDSGERLPPRVVVAILSEALHGLHAAHEAVDERGQPLGLVHRDMSPQNILVGSDGISRVLDFGVAKAAGRVHTTRDGDIKGKVLYMAPEHLAAQPLTRTADVYAAGVVLFETLTCVRMFAGDNEGAAISKIIQNQIRLPSEIDPELAPFDDVVRRATAALPEGRYATALEMAVALEALHAPASAADVSACVQRLASDVLDERAKIVAEIERSSTRSKPPLPMPASGPVKLWDRERSDGGSGVSSGVASGVMSGVVAVPQLPPMVPVAPRRSLATGTIVLLGALLVGALAVIVLLLARHDPTPASAAAAAAPAPPSADTASAAVVRRPDPPPEVSASTPAAKAAAPSSTAEAAPSASASASASAARKNVPPTPGTNRTVARLNCDPPYTIDKNGRQHFIPECMK